MKTNLPVTGKERTFADTDNIMSTTDLKGIITDVNPTFIEISGFARDELLDINHNVVRHPDMPPAAFADLWENVKAGRTWMGVVKNRCKNGDHYWVDAFVNPIMRDGAVVEYQSVRTKPTATLVATAEALYAGIRAGKLPLALRLPAIGVRGRMLAGVTLATASALASASWFGLALTDAAVPLGIAALLATAATWIGTQPLARLHVRAKMVVSNPLSQYVYTGRRDEFGEIELAMRMLETETRATSVRIADSATTLANQAEQMVASATQSREAIFEQQAQIDQVATAVEEMAASVREVAQNAQQTADAAHAAGETAQVGHRVTAGTGEAIDALSEEIERAAAVIQELEQRSDEISSVLDVIRAIAEQTNLLALNAAIEAARAGEQGRGFAVVADEVRNLASRTQSSTREIQSMIEKLQAGARSSVQVMRTSRTQAEQSVAQARKAGASLEEITGNVQEITDMSTQIATAVEEQSAVGEEISRSVVSIREAADRNTATSQEIEQTAQQLSALALDLRALAEQFWKHRK